MVIRAYGSVNGHQIILTPVGGDRWETVVPFQEDGEYVVELYAEDEAGNTGYMCTILFAISGHTMQAYIVPRGYTATGNKGTYTAYPVFEGISVKLKKSPHAIEQKKRGYLLKIRKGGYEIEHAVCRYVGN